jgi:hypothetical protein
MTIRTLITLLQTYDQNATIVVADGYGDPTTLVEVRQCPPKFHVTTLAESTENHVTNGVEIRGYSS